MTNADIEKTIRKLNDCIVNPRDRMSEVAIGLMVQLVQSTIGTADGVIVEILAKNGIHRAKDASQETETGKKAGK